MVKKKAAKVNKQACLECGKLLTGRPDKKFCNSNCKNAYNNDLHKGDASVEMRRISGILRKNRRILMTILGDAKGRKEKKDIMMRKGFSFDYITQTEGSYRFCFEFGYTKVKDDYYFIVKGFGEIVSKE